MSEKEIKYTIVPSDDLKEEAIPDSGFNPAGEPKRCGKRCCLRKTWRRALAFILCAVLIGHLVYAGVFHFLFRIFGTPGSCTPSIKLEGKNEYLFEPSDVEGLIFSVKGFSSQGSVIIREDPWAQHYINVTNTIYVSEDSLQDEVRVESSIIDKDATINIVTPSFDVGNKCVRVDTVITFPSKVKYFRSLAVDVPNSWIATERLNNIDFAFVNLKTANGHIFADKLSFTEGEIATVNGNIRGHYAVAEKLEIKNVNGIVDVEPRVHPWADNVAIDIRSVNGHIDAHVRDLSENQVVKFKAHSVNGGIIITISDSFKGRFVAKTFVGFANVEGKDITFETNRRTYKSGTKGLEIDDRDNDDDDDVSSATLEAYTGSVELYFK
ncbi:9879_t:CDS:2 [Paraglomus occultum]|uniref:9879_t:CDS:1 n=1 Tax=Paraglomus occultum TaxID=144539 RepID=A0A9N8W6G5_9GLOM|nr:9879_t:CDS:2 [Paraglomus occultum]